MKILKPGLAVLCLLPLCACSARPPAVEHKLVELTPPAVLLEECACPAAPQQGADNLALLNYALELQSALTACNSDKRALREFYELAKDLEVE